MKSSHELISFNSTTDDIYVLPRKARIIYTNKRTEKAASRPESSAILQQLD